MAKWEVEKWHIADGATLKLNGEVIAGVVPGEDGDASSRDEEIARKLNAFDEMLGALRDIQMLDDSGPSGLTWVELGKARSIASAAITKAEGK